MAASSLAEVVQRLWLEAFVKQRGVGVTFPEDPGHWVPVAEARKLLGITRLGYLWLLTVGRLTELYGPDRRRGVTRASLEAEVQWQARSTVAERTKRNLADLLGFL